MAATNRQRGETVASGSNGGKRIAGAGEKHLVAAGMAKRHEKQQMAAVGGMAKALSV